MHFGAHIRPSELFEAYLWELVLNREFTGENISPWLTVVNRWCGESKSYSTLIVRNRLLTVSFVADHFDSEKCHYKQ